MGRASRPSAPTPFNVAYPRTLYHVYWIVHNFVRVHFTTRQVPAVALGILDHGFALHELFLIQKAA